MATRGTIAISVLAVAAALAGCGGASDAAGGRAGGTNGSPSGSGVRARSGRAVFRAECGTCHSLNGGDDPRRQGGDLLGFHASLATLRQFTAEMPVRHPLSPPELSAVVRYVASVEQRGPG